jgi:hypothetical protein
MEEEKAEERAEERTEEQGYSRETRDRGPRHTEHD